MILTRELIKAGAGPTGGYNAAQVGCFGLTWKGLKKGWIDSLIGTDVSEENYRRFLALRTLPKRKTMDIPFDAPPEPVRTAVEAADNHLRAIVSNAPYPSGWSKEVIEIHERIQKRKSLANLANAD